MQIIESLHNTTQEPQISFFDTTDAFTELSSNMSSLAIQESRPARKSNHANIPPAFVKTSIANEATAFSAAEMPRQRQPIFRYRPYQRISTKAYKNTTKRAKDLQRELSDVPISVNRQQAAKGEEETLAIARILNDLSISTHHTTIINHYDVSANPNKLEKTADASHYIVEDSYQKIYRNKSHDASGKNIDICTKRRRNNAALLFGSESDNIKSLTVSERLYLRMNLPRIKVTPASAPSSPAASRRTTIMDGTSPGIQSMKRLEKCTINTAKGEYIGEQSGKEQFVFRRSMSIGSIPLVHNSKHGTSSKDFVPRHHKNNTEVGVLSRVH